MGRYDGIYWQPMQLPLAAGLQQRSDERARPQPYLGICRDVQFDEVGGLQTRHPYDAAAGSIFGGGTIANARRIVEYGSELVLFTKDSLYSWNAQLAKWVLRATHLAVAVDETPRFTGAGDQIDGDRAELSGTIVYAWTEAAQVYAAALGKTSGSVSVLVAPTAVPTAVGRPRLVALATKILLFTDAGSSNLTVRAIDPAAPGTAIAGAGTTVLASNYNAYYDVVKAGTQDLVVGACRRSTTTSYTVFSVTPALVVTTATKARTADGPLAVATIPDGTKTQVVRGNSTNVQGDLLTTSTLADLFTAQAIGTATTPINQIAAAFSSTSSGGNFTATAFWSGGEAADDTAFRAKSNTVTTANAVGSQATITFNLGVASRAFEHDGNVYVWLAFAGESTAIGLSATPLGVRSQLQNTYYLYRSDGRLISRAAFDVAGGFSPSIGHLPGVALTAPNTYAWSGARRRVIEIGGDTRTQTAFGARSPLDISFEFDANRARRCARLGATLYVSGGLLLQYDGVDLVEVGFLVYPWVIVTTDTGGGALAAGNYAIKSTLQWKNATGEQERSTTATGSLQAVLANGKITIGTVSLGVTLKTSTRNPPSIEDWRTAVNPTEDSPYYRVTSTDPTALTGDNRYVPNDVTIFQNPPVSLHDNFTDAILTTKEANPENGAVLESLAPPGASIIFATDTRLFLLGVAGDPDRGWYSRLRGASEIASFHDTLTFDIPRPGGDVTAGWFDENGTLYVARRTAIYAFVGPGLDNLGQGQNYTFARIVSSDIGVVSQEAVALTPRGVLFQSRKGWHLLGGNGALQYVGEVSDFEADAVLAIDVVEKQHQVRILHASRMVVWDYLVDQWGEWTIADGVHACMYQGAHVYLAATGTRTQRTDYTGIDYGIDIETSWIKPANMTADAQNDRAAGGQGDGAVRKLQPLGEFRSTHALRFRVAYNYLDTYVDDKTWVPSASGVQIGAPLQIKHGPKRPRCEAIKLRLTVSPALTLDTAAEFAIGAGAGLWSAVLIAATVTSLHLHLAFAETPTPTVEVRDNETFDGVAWIAAPGSTGISITSSGDIEGHFPTVGQLELAIAEQSRAVRILVPDPHPEASLDIFVADPTAEADFTPLALGESLKLTGLGMEVGINLGLYRRQPPAQQQ